MANFLSPFLDDDQFNLISLLFLSIPLSFLLHQIPNKYYKIAYTIFFSATFHHIMFPFEKYFLWSQQQIVYLILIFGPRKYVGTMIIVESFIFVCGIQLRRMYIAYAVNGIDITGILMMQVFLYVGLGYNYQNGIKSENELTEDALKRRII